MSTYYVDQVHGLDTNSGTASTSPKQTLAAVRALAANGDIIALACGSYWRETLDLSAITGVTIQTVGTGPLPVIDGADVFTAWTKTGGRTNVYQTSVTHNATDTARLTVYENGLLLKRVADQAACDALPGSFVDVKGSDGSPVTVYIHATGDSNPASNGQVYEVTTRLYALAGGDGLTMTGVQAMRAIINDGAVAMSARLGVNLSRLLTLNGTKHNAVIGSGAVRDSIALFADPPTSYEPSDVGWTGYVPDPTGLSLLFERVGTIDIPGNDYISHGNGPESFASSILRQCWTVGCPFTNIPGATVTRLSEGCYARGITSPTTAGTCSKSMFYVPQANSYGSYIYSPTFQDSVFYVETRYASANYEPVFLATSSVTFDHVAFAGMDLYDYYFKYEGFSSGSMVSNGSVYFGGNHSMFVPTGVAYTGDYNVIFCTKPEGEQVYLRYHGTDYTTLASWQTATGQDANSVYLLAADQTAGNANAFWLGVKNAAGGTDLSTVGPKSGDWRINPSARVYAANGTAYVGTFPDGTAITTAGPQMRWNWMTRASVPGAPREWPTVPTTLADARAYTANPGGWQFSQTDVALPQTTTIQIGEFITREPINIVRGQNYRVASGNPLDFRFPGGPNLIGATVTLVVGRTLVAGLITSAESVRFELTAAQSLGLAATNYAITMLVDDHEVRLLAAGACNLS